MNTELIKKAYDHFGGVWPSKDVFLGEYVENHVSGVILITTKKNPEYEEVGCVSLGGPNYNREYYQGVTKEEFEQYGEIFKSEWTPKVDDEWIPEVGEDFEWMLECVSSKWNYGYLVGFDKDGDMVIQRELGLDGLNTTKVNHTYKFRPLKTEREKNVDEIKSVIDRWQSLGNNGTLLLAENLVDAGYAKQTNTTEK